MMLFLPEDNFRAFSTAAFDVENEVGVSLQVNKAVRSVDPFLVISLVAVFFVPQDNVISSSDVSVFDIKNESSVVTANESGIAK